jgi:hypothetical protein
MREIQKFQTAWGPLRDKHNLLSKADGMGRFQNSHGHRRERLRNRLMDGIGESIQQKEI